MHILYEGLVGVTYGTLSKFARNHFIKFAISVCPSVCTQGTCRFQLHGFTLLLISGIFSNIWPALKWKKYTLCFHFLSRQSVKLWYTQGSHKPQCNSAHALCNFCKTTDTHTHTHTQYIFYYRYSFVRLRWSRGSVLAFGTQVRGFKPVGFLRSKKSSGEVKPSVPCRRFTACKRSLELRGITWKSNCTRNLSEHFPPTKSSTFRC